MQHQNIKLEQLEDIMTPTSNTTMKRKLRNRKETRIQNRDNQYGSQVTTHTNKSHNEEILITTKKSKKDTLQEENIRLSNEHNTHKEKIQKLYLLMPSQSMN